MCTTVCIARHPLHRAMALFAQESMKIGCSVLRRFDSGEADDIKAIA
jgi:hypothetical protein